MIARAWRIAVTGSVLLVILLSAVWYFTTTQSQDSSYGTTTGEIIVSSPEVYSRERLVNDRFQEATWLQGQLDKTEKLDWGVEASMQSSRSDRNALSISAAVTAGESDGASSKSTAPASDVRSAESSASSDGARPGPGRGNQQNAGLDTPPPPSPIDLFRDKVAYREEVRAASLETQLDDRHDIAGNTLYRIKFSVTVVPENDTSAWAVVYVEIKEGNSEEDNRGSGNTTYRELYHDWLSYYRDQLNAELDRLTDGATQWQPDERSKFNGYLTSEVRKSVCGDAARDPDCKTRLAERTAAAQRAMTATARKQLELQQEQCEDFAKSNPGVQCKTAEEVEKVCDSPWFPPASCPWLGNDNSRLDPLLRTYRESRYPSEPGRTPPTMRQFFREVVAQYLVDGLQRWTKYQKQSGQLHQDLWSASVTDCEVGLCRIELEPRDDAVDDFRQALGTDQVFAYAVSPKESVQRIANLAASQREHQLAVRATLSAEGVAPGLLDSLLQQSQRDDSLLQAVLRKPLIVGFAEPSGSQKESAREVAAFGWIIGPRFQIEGNNARFRHVVTEDDVSAIISVPSWWKWAEANITTCWMDERAIRTRSHPRDGFDGYTDCKDKRRTNLPPIRLPATSTEVARKLGLDVVRRPSVAKLRNIVVREGERADILIRGNHLWRSTVVTLGGQPADNITVLPDMKGIVARFERVLPKPPNAVEGNPVLSVFTSEGEAQAGVVTIVKPDPTAATTSNIATAPDRATIALNLQNATEVTR